jgi:hypothetical protein
MCKTNYERKYYKYQIILEYLNGDKETIKHNDDRVKTYKGSLELYRETKEQYKDECVTIKFCGLTEDGDLEVLWEKAIINEDMIKESEKAKEIKENGMIHMLENLTNSIENIFNRSEFVKEQTPLISKQQDILLHNIESYEGKNEKEKINIFNELQSIRNQRRILNREYELKTEMFDRLNGDTQNLKHIQNIINGLIGKYKVIENKEYVQLDKDKLEEFNIMKRVPYTSNTDKKKKLNELQKNFVKVIIDEEKNKLEKEQNRLASILEKIKEDN